MSVLETETEPILELCNSLCGDPFDFFDQDRFSLTMFISQVNDWGVGWLRIKER